MRALVAVIGVASLLALGLVTPAQAAGHGHRPPPPPPPPPSGLAPFSAHLTRAPYLTDLVGLHVAVNFATDESGTTATVLYGAESGGSCTPTTSVPATQRTILVGTVYEYQWAAEIDLPSAGTYCYRAYLGAVDLLATNPSPTFTTQQQPGDTSPFTFDVMGDWGQVDSTGQNTDQANLMQQIAASKARFLVTVGDNGYPDGSQINYGDLQQTGANTSAIFGQNFWTAPGLSTPIFAAPGNHGTSGTAHTDITTWTENAAVSNSGGRYQDDVYCCVNNSKSTHYGSEWYAFTAGNARFYVLDASWGDTNSGTATPYANDAAAHWAPGDPEYDWLVSDLQSHPTQLKFAFFHYPLYSDNPNQTSDTSLDGPAGLEGLMAGYGVQMVFNGHAHIYERNHPSGPGMPVSYVTGGGGGTLEPVGPCSAHDAYSIGWSPTKSTGSACNAPRPKSAAAVYNFLKVTVSGNSVTVAPTNSLGTAFDVDTYTFNVSTDTWIDSGPPAGTTSTTATFGFHASGSPATFTCTLDGGQAAPCTSPVTYVGLAEGSHTFSVDAVVAGQPDPTPATQTWAVDTTAPNTPTGLSGAPASAYEVDLAWSAATDNTGVTGYRLYRDGSPLDTTGAVTTYVDNDVQPGTTHTYTVSALDAAGNESPPSDPVSVTTPPPAVPVFADGFESGNLSAWGATGGLTVESGTVYDGGYAAEGNTTNGATYAKKTLPSTYPDAYAQVHFDVVSQASQVNLLRLRDAAGNSLGYVFVNSTGKLGVFDDATATTTASDVVVAPGWHSVQLRRAADTTAGTPSGALQVWFDGAQVAALSGASIDVGSAPVGAMQIGETQTGRTYDVVFDDAAFSTQRLSPTPDNTPPTTPGDLQASAASATEIDLSWTASTDDTGVAGYDVYRNGAPLGSVGAGTTGYQDVTAQPSTTYSYTVRAFDAFGNESQAAAAGATTPAGATAVFADGFELGNLSAWDTSGGLTAESGTAYDGSYAAEGNTTNGAT
ncbi:MAG: metallophosphoesterase, partial [Nocardioidaceae bacterium]